MFLLIKLLWVLLFAHGNTQPVQQNAGDTFCTNFRVLYSGIQDHFRDIKGEKVVDEYGEYWVSKTLLDGVSSAIIFNYNEGERNSVINSQVFIEDASLEEAEKIYRDLYTKLKGCTKLLTNTYDKTGKPGENLVKGYYIKLSNVHNPSRVFLELSYDEEFGYSVYMNFEAKK